MAEPDAPLLDGVTILDLTSMISGPLATMMLADQGANVIKVESPSGDYARHVATRRNGFSASFVNNNRNKRSIVLDLKHPAGLDALRGLIRQADVMVQNFRPGVATRMGVGPEQAQEINPSLIYLSIAGFGFTGPFRDKPVFDPLIQALSGLTTIQGGADNTRPRLVRTILPDKLTAMQASQIILAALFARERQGGPGKRIELSMLDTIVSFLWSSDMGGHTFVGEEVSSETAQSFIDLIYETRDGYVSIAVMQDKHWQGFLKAVGRRDLIEDARFATPALREINKNERVELIQSLVADNNTERLIDDLEAFDVPCSPVLTRSEMIQHPQIIANQIVGIHQHPQAGALRQTRPAPQLANSSAFHPVGAPALGQHTREVLIESGMSEQAVNILVETGAAICTQGGVDGR
ncbi:MAG: CaiB/BaiF CoA transferase family protein [Burkholderiaceae bacterium]